MYLVPDVTLIPQTRSMACWYASAKMLIQWKRNSVRTTFADHPDPSELSQTVVWEVSNQGITNPQVIQLAKRLGLRAVPPQTPSLYVLDQLLRAHGPLWTNGRSHIVVIGGVDEGSGGRVFVYDPWPVNMGKAEWRSFQSYLSGTGPAVRDTGSDVQAIFLYHP
jgi:ABC-type bacteriocin/lantibiotic exporter with double-glycine peptidase domain